FDWFCSTLTVSPHKNSQLINQIGYRLSEVHNIPWLPSDFKKRNGYLRSIELSKEYGLYRQDYCGCRYSVRTDR
ncbi:MAG: epoxyqueuosine reductase QueH, partial [Oscillospiraceae bacterium]|nr:epoxyqueuosine reductase QueH [Oscillospiraceae bacterium]